jgi:hypothetical protein
MLILDSAVVDTHSRSHVDGIVVFVFIHSTNIGANKGGHWPCAVLPWHVTFISSHTRPLF